HRRWFLTIRPRSGTKGIRDSIIHRTSAWMIWRHRVPSVTDWTIRAALTAESRDVPGSDAILEIETIVHGLFDFLSALPGEIWNVQRYEVRDLRPCLDGPVPGMRFLPLRSL